MVLQTFNSLHKRLQFTVEIEKENKINFLNVLLIRDNTVIISYFFYKSSSFGEIPQFLLPPSRNPQKRCHHRLHR